MNEKAAIMEQYIKLVAFLGQVLGEDCEILLQDLSQDKRSVVAIANGHVSHRKAGAPLTELAMQILADGSWQHEDCYCNYESVTEDGRKLRSSTFYIKNGNELIGLLGINFDSRKYIDLSQRILELGGIGLIKKAGGRDKAEEAEPLIKHVEKLAGSMEDAVTHTVQAYMTAHKNIPAERLSQEDRLNIIRELDAKNIFMLKGAIPCVAEQIRCSEASVYRYLSKINNGY